MMKLMFFIGRLKHRELPKNYFGGKNKLLSRKESNKGQAFLIVVLIMVIALTVGLSIASRTVTNLKMSSEEANSQKAFSAAESGIEQVLQSPGSTSTIGKQTFNNGSSIVAISQTYVGQGSTKVLLDNGDPVSKDEGADIWFTPFIPASLYTTYWPTDGITAGDFTVYWGDYPAGPAPTSQFCSYAAIELIVITGTSKTSSDLQMSRWPVENGCSGSPQRSKNFPLPNASGVTSFNGDPNVNFLFGNRFNTLKKILFVRAIPLFANTKVGVQINNSGMAFPSTGEGQLIVSQGSAGSTQRQVNYFETWDTVPSAFIFSFLSSQ